MPGCRICASKKPGQETGSIVGPLTGYSAHRIHIGSAMNGDRDLARGPAESSDVGLPEPDWNATASVSAAMAG